jgi:hypothetical protein
MVDPVSLKSGMGSSVFLYDANTSVITLFPPSVTSNSPQSLRASGVSGGSAYQVPVGYKLNIMSIASTGGDGTTKIFDGGLDSNAGTLMIQFANTLTAEGMGTVPVNIPFVAGDYVNAEMSGATNTIICTGILTTT